MEVAGRVEPRLLVVIGHVDDERVAFPATPCIAHPRLQTIVVRRPVCVNQPVDLRPLKRHGDGFARLQDLKRPLQVHHARQARHEALRQRVRLRPLRKVLRLLRGGPRLIRNLAALDDAQAGRHHVSGQVIAQVGRRMISHLPDPVEVRPPVRRPRNRWRRLNRLSVNPPIPGADNQ